MTGFRRAPIVLWSIVLATTAALAGPPPDPETERLLAVVAKAEAAPAWLDAVRTLKAGTADQRARADALLDRLARERHAAWTAAAAKVADLASKAGDGRAAADALKAWDEAREHARAFVFDVVRFPVPANPKITGPCEGYDEAKPRGDAATRAFEKLEPFLARALAPALRLAPARARELADAREAARAAFALVVAHAPAATRDALFPPVPDPLADRLLALRAGDFAGFRDAWRIEPDGWRRLLLFHAWCETILARNEERTFEMEGDALRGLRELNAYRRVLGISPVVHDERLARAARGHSAEMTSRGYFSHRSPTPGRETKDQRAALEGYRGQVVECITAVGGGAAAIEFWKYDGGHHRDMVDPKYVEGGFSTRGPAVYVGGAGDATSLPVIEYRAR